MHYAVSGGADVSEYCRIKQAKKSEVDCLMEGVLDETFEMKIG